MGQMAKSGEISSFDMLWVDKLRFAPVGRWFVPGTRVIPTGSQRVRNGFRLTTSAGYVCAPKMPGPSFERTPWVERGSHPSP